MKISIITATWNSEATIRDTIRAILSQDYKDWEHIIIDGGSTDRTIPIIHEMEPLYKGHTMTLIIGQDRGIYDAMNKGLREASGDVIGTLNSDDFYADTTILSRIAKSIEDVDIVYGNLDFVDHIETDKIVRRWVGSQHYPGAFLKGWHPAHPTFYARRELFERYGGFDLSFAVSADFELMLRFLERKETTSRFIDYTIVKMRMGGESTGSLWRIIRGNHNILRAFRRNGFHVSPLYLYYRLAPKFREMVRYKLTHLLSRR